MPAFQRKPGAPTKTMGRVPGMLEEANQFLWDSQAITSSAATWTLFQTVQSSDKNKLLTNMTQSGVLPVPKMMRVKALRFILHPVCTAADAKIILGASYLEFWVNDKSVLEGPVFMFAQGCGVDTAATTKNDTAESAHNGTIDPRGIYVLRNSIDIGVQTPFNVKVITTTSGTGGNNITSLSATTLIWIVLEGEMWRGVS